MNSPALVLLLLIAMTLLTACGQQTPQEVATTKTTSMETAIRSNNQGVGLMGSFDYPGALALFENPIDPIGRAHDLRGLDQPHDRRMDAARPLLRAR